MYLFKSVKRMKQILLDCFESCSDRMLTNCTAFDWYYLQACPCFLVILGKSWIDVEYHWSPYHQHCNQHMGGDHVPARYFPKLGQCHQKSLTVNAGDWKGKETGGDERYQFIYQNWTWL